MTQAFEEIEIAFKSGEITRESATAQLRDRLGYNYKFSDDIVDDWEEDLLQAAMNKILVGATR